MVESIIKSFNIWTDAQGVKSRGRVRSIDNISLEGLTHLRELILELAIRGKLVPQDPADEPASELLKKIEKEKEQLIKDGRIKKEKLLLELSDEEKPFNLPNGWQWVRLQDITSYVQRGKSPVYADSGSTIVISQKCIQWDGFIVSNGRYVDDNSLSRYEVERFIVLGDILWNSTGTGTVGRVTSVENLPEQSLVADSHVTIVRPLLSSSRYLKIFLSSKTIQDRIVPGATNSLVSGTTNQVELNRNAVVSLPVPLPSLAEQHRIIAKVEELMALCDELEKEKTASLKTHQILVAALLQTLTAAKDAGEVEMAWHRLVPHFDTLFCTEDSIDQLKQTILQLAIMGRLVKQDPADEPAGELLKKIEKEKEKLVKEGKIKKEKPLSEIKEEEKPFVLPKGWEWCRLGEVGILKRGKSKHRPRNDKRLFENGTYPFIQTGEVSQAKKQSGMITSINGYYNDFGLRQSEMQKAGTLCITIAANIAEYGFLSIDACVPDSIVCFESVENVNANFVSFFIDVSKDMLEKFAPSTAQKNINLGILSDLKFPFPPLTEQQRIVAKAEELMTLCNSLKEKLLKSQEIQNALSKTIVENAVA